LTSAPPAALLHPRRLESAPAALLPRTSSAPTALLPRTSSAPAALLAAPARAWPPQPRCCPRRTAPPLRCSPRRAATVVELLPRRAQPPPRITGPATPSRSSFVRRPVAANQMEEGGKNDSMRGGGMRCGVPCRILFDARVMFDGTPAQKRGKEDEQNPAEVGGEGRIDSLPDALLHHVLSLLPAEEAVRTCVLARRWHHLWKSAPGLLIGCLRDDEPVSVNALQRLVDGLFLLRRASPLDTCELRIGDFSKDGDEGCVNLWFRNAVVCNVRELTLHVERNNYVDPWLLLLDMPLVSQHLTSLKLHCVRCHDNFLDFASCAALEHLEFEHCHFSWATKISSESIKSLSITDCPLSDDFRLRIYAPNLVSLHLDEFWGRAPILENMPSLVEAFIRVTVDCVDWCDKLCDDDQDCNCEYCDSGNIGNGSPVLLKGLSRAKKLVLISKAHMMLLKT
ncbi:hypothetical protein EJB05_36979, partial [Eragrostis curvula]